MGSRLNRGAGFEPTTLTAGKRRDITNVAERIYHYTITPPHRSSRGYKGTSLVLVWSLINLAFPNTGS